MRLKTMDTLHLHFDVGCTSDEAPELLDGEAALERAMELSFRWICLNWAEMVEVTLPVEDDILFLALAHAELREFAERSHVHRVFLGDGLLDVTAHRDGEIVTMTVCHTPHLDRRFSNSRTMVLNIASYQRAWHKLAGELRDSIARTIESGSNQGECP